MKKKAVYHFECVDCGAGYDGNALAYLCPGCREKNKPGQPPLGVLKTVFDYAAFGSKSWTEIKGNSFFDLLPLSDPDQLPPLRIGHTPLYLRKKLNGKELPFDICFKDDSVNPSYSFKDRASAIVSARAREMGKDTIVVASTGNAGSSMACICAAQGQKAIVLVPADAPAAKMLQIRMYGARIVPVDGNYDDAYELSVQCSEATGWYNRNTAYNPLTIEGKKTVSFELFDQLGQQLPDTLFIPTGDGVILAGVYKGFEDLMLCGYTDSIPKIVSVQASGSDNLVRNLNATHFQPKRSHTIADSISVDVPRNFHMASRFIHAYNGEYLAVSDEQILEASLSLSRQYGLFAEPAAAAAYAGLLKYHKQDRLSHGGRHVVLLTGSGLKDPAAMLPQFDNPKPVAPTLNALMQYLHDTV